MVTQGGTTGAWPTDLTGGWDTLEQHEEHRTGLIQDDFENAPRNWTAPAILSAIFFLPTGIIAVQNARKAQRAIDDGDHGLWRHYIGRTRFFVFLSVFLGVLAYGLLILVINVVKNS